MKHILLSFILALAGAVGYASPKSVLCTMKGMEVTISFIIPTKSDELPKIDFPYPVKTTTFSMRADNLLLIAMDEEDASRPRIFLSAQLQKSDRTYVGQFMTDFGGNQLQLDNGPVSCTLH